MSGKPVINLPENMKDLKYFVIIDSSSLLSHKTQEFITPVSTHNFSKTESESFVAFASLMGLIVPKQVIDEVSNLYSKHKNPDNKDYDLYRKKISRVKKRISNLYKFKNNSSSASVVTGDDIIIDKHEDNPMKISVLGLNQFGLNVYLDSSKLVISNIGFDIDDSFLNYDLRENEIGLDSPTDKKLVSLAYELCTQNPDVFCYIMTKDSGIELEVCSLFYGEGIKVGCSVCKEDWIKKVNSEVKNSMRKVVLKNIGTRISKLTSRIEKWKKDRSSFRTKFKNVMCMIKKVS